MAGILHVPWFQVRQLPRPELVGRVIGTAYVDPGKPWQNGTGESFNGKFRDEFLSLEGFRSRAEARVVIENWRRHYNETRPHSSLHYLTPLEFKRQHSIDISHLRRNQWLDKAQAGQTNDD